MTAPGNDASETPQAGTEPAVTPTPAAQSQPATQPLTQPAAPAAEASYNPPATDKPAPSETADGWKWTSNPKNGLVRVTASGPNQLIVTSDSKSDSEARAAVQAQIKALTGRKES